MSPSGQHDCDPTFLTVLGHVRRGVKGVVNVQQPAAGQEWSQAVPGGEQWRVITGQATLATSAAVANRTPRLRITDGTNPMFETTAPTPIAANITVRINVQAGQLSQAATQGIWSLILGMPSMWLPPGAVITSLTDLLQAGDQYSSIRLFVERAFETDTDLTDEHYEYVERGRKT